jgi:glycosyltransferase involved in cell wall biosynthesis
MPIFSVIIPIFNSELFLKRCLDSVLAQTFNDYEIICVDDGSTDNSADILIKYRLKDKRIKVITQKNMGQGEARNVALKQAQGEYIYFLDSDDWIDSTLFQSALSIFKENNTDLFCFNTEVCGDETLKLFKRAKKYSQLALSGFLPFSNSMKDITNVYLWNKIFKRDLITKYDIQFPTELCYEDIAFTKMYFLVSETVYFDMRRFHHYTIRKDSLMGKNFKSEKIALDHFKNWYKIFTMARKDRELLEENRQVIEKWFWDYYFFTKSMLKNSYNVELEELKDKFFKEFDKH